MKAGWLSRYNDGQGIAVRFSAGTRNSSPLHSSEATTGAHPVPYIVLTKVLSQGFKAEGK
jgi:hypothetical protein